MINNIQGKLFIVGLNYPKSSSAIQCLTDPICVLLLLGWVVTKVVISWSLSLSQYALEFLQTLANVWAWHTHSTQLLDAWCRSHFLSKLDRLRWTWTHQVEWRPPFVAESIATPDQAQDPKSHLLQTNNCLKFNIKLTEPIWQNTVLKTLKSK